MPRVHAVPSVKFGNGAEMHEPVHLYGFPQVAWSMSWYPTANACNFLQFQLALRVRFLGCHFLGKFGVTLSKEYCCIAGNRHRFQLLLLVGCLWVVDEVKRVEFLLDSRFHVEQTLAVHTSVHSGMSSGALLHELSKHTCMVCFFPFLGHMVEDAFTLSLTFPVRNHLTFVSVDIRLRDMVGLQLTSVESVKVFHTVTGQFGKRRHSLWHWSSFTHNEFVITDIDGFLLADFVEIACTEHRSRHSAVVLLIERSLNQSSFYRQSCRCVEVLLTQTLDALVHSAFIGRIFDLEIHDSMYVFLLLQK